MSKDILIVFLDIVPFSEYTILFAKTERIINEKCIHFAEVLHYFDCHARRQIIVLRNKMDVKIKTKNKKDRN